MLWGLVFGPCFVVRCLVSSFVVSNFAVVSLGKEGWLLCYSCQSVSCGRVFFFLWLFLVVLSVGLWCVVVCLNVSYFKK